MAHFACGGAKIADLIANQLPLIPSNTDLITVTIGGNDAGFAPIITNCILAVESCIDDNKPEEIRALFEPLRDVYLSLKQAAPQGRIVVLTYPQIFTNDNRILNFECLGDKGITPDERTWLRSIQSTFNDTARLAAQAAQVEVVSLDDDFLGHEVCTQEPYVLGYEGATDPSSFHPNVPGNRTMASELSGYLSGTP